MRSKTGSGLRQPGLMAFARKALTRMKGLTSLIFMTAVKLEVVMEISNRSSAVRYEPSTIVAERDFVIVHKSRHWQGRGFAIDPGLNPF
jgi:hypothetical protein